MYHNYAVSNGTQLYLITLHQ